MTIAAAALLAGMTATTCSADDGANDASLRYALVIGNANYPGAELPASRTNVRVVQNWLREAAGYRPDEIHAAEDVDRTEFLRRLDELNAAIPADGPRAKQIFIYFSGHGSTRADDDGDESRQVGPHRPLSGDEVDEVFVMIPAAPIPSGRRSPGAYPEGDIVRDDEFYARICGLSGRCDELVVVVEACHAGGLSRGAGDPESAEPGPSMAMGGFLEVPGAIGGAAKGADASTDQDRRYGRAVELRGASGSGDDPQGDQSQADRPQANQPLAKGTRPEFDLGCTLLFFAAAGAHETAAAPIDGGASLFTEEVLDAFRGPQMTWRALCASLEDSDRLYQYGQTPVVLNGNLQREDFVVREELFGLGDARSDHGFEALEWEVRNLRTGAAVDLSEPLPERALPQLTITPRSDLYLYVLEEGVSEAGGDASPRRLSAWPRTGAPARAGVPVDILLPVRPEARRIRVLGSPYLLPALNAARLMRIPGAAESVPAPEQPTPEDQDDLRELKQTLFEYREVADPATRRQLADSLAATALRNEDAVSMQREYRDRFGATDRRLALVVARTDGAFPPVRVTFSLPGTQNAAATD
ncbi:caspase family protein [Alienimonas chondri]|uniref:caspase family protein n=1 Tax=Alienimonas chondri TaxID=2681879 RepID=UPI0014880BC1|nr:caspase family protein [Alienimonas chondri]